MSAKPAFIPRPRRYVCRCIRLRDGFPEFLTYIGHWNGWKEISDDVSVYSWRAA